MADIKQEIHSYSRYQIQDRDNLDFSPAEYSKFKFGDYALASKFGHKLFQGFLEKYEDLILQEKEIVLLPSPYDHIPTASYFLAIVFRDLLNDYLYTQGKKSLIFSRIHRNKTYSVDYGNLNFEERINLISSDTYHLDASFLENKLCILIDDVKISGSHELVLKRTLDKSKISGKFLFAYFAELVNKDIHPRIENHLNYFYVKSLNEILEIIKGGNFQFNTRVIKYMLISEREDLKSFLPHMDKNDLEKLVKLSIGNNYHIMEEYKSNLEYIINEIDYTFIGLRGGVKPRTSV